MLQVPVKHPLVLLALLVPVVCAAQTPSERLARLSAEVFEQRLDLFPVGEIFGRGAGPRQDRVELTLSDEHRERQRAHIRSTLKQLEAIAQDGLSESEKLTHALLERGARDWEGWLSYPFHQHSAFNHIGGGVVSGMVQVVNRQPLRNEDDYRKWFTRLRRYTPFWASVERVMREGMAAGITTPRVIVERTLGQLEALAPKEMEKSSLWKPMTSFPASIDAASRARLEAEYRQLLAEEAFPALRRLAAFAREEYLPRARTTDGFGALPGGDRMYRHAVRSETTTDLTPEEIHDRGLREVARIQALFLAAATKAGYDGAIGGFRSWLALNPANHPFRTSDEVIAYLNALNARIVPQLPKLFGRLPRSRFVIQPMDATIAGSAPASYYWPTDDGKPGIFAMPIVNPRHTSILNLASLLAHEGMPGHHMETIKFDNPVPEFRRRIWFGAFGEGWALYAESLGQEMGLYDTPLALVGRYSDELYRACRLVVDTAIHSKGWPREKAIRYMLDECASTEAAATNEVLRYMVWPGQALNYKIGELMILELRAKAEKQLGSRFDIRAFHDAILGEGPVPLEMLKARMEAWTAAQARRGV